MPLTGVMMIDFTGACLPAWYASSPSSKRVTHLAPLVVAGLVAFQVQVFLYVPWYWPRPTETLTEALTCAEVRSEQASSDGAALADGVMAAPMMRMAAIAVARLTFEDMSGASFAACAYSIASVYQTNRDLGFDLHFP